MSSLRARRMARNHRRMQRPARLNLVALMDIFTILVLFLMVNNGDVEVLQPDRQITLPESSSEQRPEESLTIKVSAEGVRVQGRPVVTLEAAMAEEGMLLAALQAELQQLAASAGPLPQNRLARGRSVIIMGDQAMPYRLLQRIMSTCASEDYRDISLAVTSIPETALAQQSGPPAITAQGS